MRLFLCKVYWLLAIMWRSCLSFVPAIYNGAIKNKSDIGDVFCIYSSSLSSGGWRKISSAEQNNVVPTTYVYVASGAQLLVSVT